MFYMHTHVYQSWNLMTHKSRMEIKFSYWITGADLLSNRSEDVNLFVDEQTVNSGDPTSRRPRYLHCQSVATRSYLPVRLSRDLVSFVFYQMVLGCKKNKQPWQRPCSWRTTLLSVSTSALCWPLGCGYCHSAFNEVSCCIFLSAKHAFC